MGYWGWKPYVSVAARRAKAEKAAAKAKKAGAEHAPIAAYRGAIAKTFWGKAWCENLERYSDFDNRLPRGRAYVRNGSVIDLQIAAGQVRAQVMGSRLYQVGVTVTAVPDKHWRAIGADCSGSIDTLVELLQGKLSKAVMERICKPGTGLFPATKEIQFNCSCPDWAAMCKHVAAVLYGIGARLDQQPELLFVLRRVDASELVAQAGTASPRARKVPAAKKVLDDSVLADVFGIEMVEAIPSAPLKTQSKSTATKGIKLKTGPTPKAQSAKPSAAKTAKPARQAKSVKAVTPVKLPASSRKSSAQAKVVKASDKASVKPRVA